jgi:hypothetical protein
MMRVPGGYPNALDSWYVQYTTMGVESLYDGFAINGRSNGGLECDAMRCGAISKGVAGWLSYGGDHVFTRRA